MNRSTHSTNPIAVHRSIAVERIPAPDRAIIDGAPRVHSTADAIRLFAHVTRDDAYRLARTHPHVRRALTMLPQTWRWRTP